MLTTDGVATIISGDLQRAAIPADASQNVRCFNHRLEALIHLNVFELVCRRPVCDDATGDRSALPRAVVHERRVLAHHSTGSDVMRLALAG